MALSDKELNEIAYLARINIDKDSFPSLKEELGQILDLFEKLNSAETDEVEAMSHPLDLSQPTRPDKVTEEDLANSLRDQYDAFKESYKKAAKMAETKAKPDYIDIDKDGDKKEPMKKAVKDKEAK